MGNNTKIPSCWSLFTMAGTEKKQCIHTTPEQAHTYRSVLFRPLQIWHISKSQWETSEVENVMLHAPYHLAYMVECAPVMVPWSSIIQGGWFSVSAGIQFRFKVCRPFTAFRTTLTGGTRAQSTGSLCPLDTRYKIPLCFAKCWSECILQARSVPL